MLDWVSMIQSLAASDKSHSVSSADVTFFLRNHTNLRTQAVVWYSLWVVLNRSMSMSWPILLTGWVVNKLCTTPWLFDFNSATDRSGISSGSASAGTTLISFFSHPGPFFHIWLTDSSSGVNSLDAGFSLPEQWFQYSTGTRLQISFTRFCPYQYPWSKRVWLGSQ